MVGSLIHGLNKKEVLKWRSLKSQGPLYVISGACYCSARRVMPACWRLLFEITVTTYRSHPSYMSAAYMCIHFDKFCILCVECRFMWEMLKNQ